VVSDEDLVDGVKNGDQASLASLYGRYAPLIFHIASQSLGPSGAEEIVQDVFFAVWKKAGDFDRRRGAFRPWVLQIAHFRVLNELRSRSRRPRLDPDSDDTALEKLADADDGPIEEIWRDYRQRSIRAALEKLPRAQRQALSLAFFEDLSHDQVADTLKIPIGTVKTRIRSGVRKLRRILLPLGIAGALGLSLLGLGWAFRMQSTASARENRALAFVTASDITLIHLGPGPGQDPRTHGSYRGREGTALAVAALHGLPASGRGEVYRVWVRHGEEWTRVGEAEVEAGGDTVIIGESPVLRALPDEVMVTREPAVATLRPRGTVVIHWPAASE
jgi:RNA polymerase sigma-70 factor (ECF subfamily)